MKLRLTLLTAATLTALSFTAHAAEKGTIMIMVNSLDNPYYASEAKGASEKAKELGYKTTILSHSEDVKKQVEITLVYEGYIKKQLEQVERMEKLEEKLLPEDINYDEVSSLRDEAREKLNAIRPISIGQASRISGVSPADISVLLVYLEQYRRQEENA